MTPRVRRWTGLAVLVLPVLLISIDMSVLGFAVPALSEDLAPSSSQLLWIIDIYSFLLAGLLVLMGNVGDRIGRRRLLMIGAGAFGAASVLAAVSTSPEMLLAARALLGVGGATLMPSTLSLIRTIFQDPREHTMAIAVWGSAFAGGSAVGPILGGFLLEHFWWGSVFLINVPVMVLLVVGALLFLPESRNPAPGPFDVLSALLSISGMLTLVYGLKAFGKDGLSAVAVGTVLIGIVLLVVFVRRQLGLAEPLLDVRLFARRTFSVAVVTNLLSVFAFLGMLFFLPQYLQLVVGMSPLEAGLWILPLAVATIVGALVAPRLAARLPMSLVVGGGMLLAAAGFLVATFLSSDGELALLLVAGVFAGAGVGLAETLTVDAIVSSAPQERAGGAAAISETAYEFGGAMGTAVLGTLGLAVYRSSLADGAPEGVPAAALEAAQQTLGGAEHVAADLPAGLVEPFLDVAHQAFASGQSLVFGVATVVCAYAGVQALVLLRRPGRRSHGSAGGQDDGPTATDRAEPRREYAR
ncbi:MFS transporter [Ornithinicoccus hortensis]|uniref:DHA2 family multidrug resistance protein-like MFS transporter n=1 Tax=Ornithinicoccus hortensis TaxID=82346 RepID=A0A542YWH5_9MICO|nr:MFS transporter [Ornithinicoccus hortensis]TQL52391.1 DHA2 family multidrug resistance protein-like MFS transporter [Ornithinicoccus hortensis]